MAGFCNDSFCIIYLVNIFCLYSSDILTKINQHSAETLVSATVLISQNL